MKRDGRGKCPNFVGWHLQKRHDVFAYSRGLEYRGDQAPVPLGLGFVEQQVRFHVFCSDNRSKSFLEVVYRTVQVKHFLYFFAFTWPSGIVIEGMDWFVAGFTDNDCTARGLCVQLFRLLLRRWL